MSSHNQLGRWTSCLGAALAATALAQVGTAQIGGPNSGPNSGSLSVDPIRIDYREFQVPGKTATGRAWGEREGAGRPTKYFYEVSPDGQRFVGPIETDYQLRLHHKQFDPVRERAGVEPSFRAGAGNELFIVQYWTQGLEDYHQVLLEQGAEIHRFLANHANIVQMNAATAQVIRDMPFVRAVRPFHPAYKFDPTLLDEVRAGGSGSITVNILTMRRGGHQPVVDWVAANGGTIEHVSEPTYLMTATVLYEQLPALARLNEVQWIDPWGPEGADMNIARQMHGADFVESAGGYTGQGVRVEVRDVGCQTNHPALPNFILHGNNTANSHGTSTAGIVLGTGAGNANGRGAMPNAFLVIRDIDHPAPGGSRYNATAELQDPNGPYRCVIQTNSVGSPQGQVYNAVSQNMDLILFDHPRISITQSQSNLNNRNSRPEAWAKNIIACGGINHFNTLTKADDRWGGASIGPAADGRIKPDVASYYDAILTTTTGGGYTSGFGGTSGATPIIAGHLGLFYQMWHAGEFGNPTPGGSVFANRPQNTTAKAALVNTAMQWTFSGTTHNLTRTHQGWGHADLQYMYQHRQNMLIVDETDVLGPFDAKTYYMTVGANEDQFRATMVYRDPPGTTSSSLHRINNLDLVVISPNGTVYKGNNDMLGNMTTTPGGVHNSVDTVENVFKNNPLAGEWRVIVYAAQVNQDNHVETGALDVDYALVVSGIQSVTPACGTAVTAVRNGGINQQTYSATPIVIGQPTTLTVGTQGFQFATFLGVVLPENRPLDSGHTALISPDTTRIFQIGRVAAVGGVAEVTQVLVTDPSLCGLTVFSQVRLDDGPGIGFVVTNALDMKIGDN